jgi:hypothetical protein
MAIEYMAGDVPRAVFSGRCVPEEADALLDWLRATPNATVDLVSCETLHTALAQLLMTAHVRLLAPPADALLAACLCDAGCVAPVANVPAIETNTKNAAHGGKRGGKGVAAGARKIRAGAA